MSQRLVQQKTVIKRLTIHEISPQWARLLPLIPETEEQQFYRNGIVLDISNPKFCVVGEAYGFNGDYMNCMNKESFCRGCHSHSINFASSLMVKPSERKELVRSFVRHWNNVHV